MRNLLPRFRKQKTAAHGRGLGGYFAPRLLFRFFGGFLGDFFLCDFGWFFSHDDVCVLLVLLVAVSN
jgi:hypothetical protein